MKLLQRLLKIVLDSLEIYIPTISFIILFCVFNLQVFYRYALNQPLTWPPEIISITFLWTTILAASYAQRNNEHVSFSVIYDRVSGKSQFIMRMIANALIAIAFTVALWPSLSYVLFMSFKKTTVLKIPYSIVFFPMIIFLVLIIGRMLYAIYTDIKVLREVGFANLKKAELS